MVALDAVGMSYEYNIYIDCLLRRRKGIESGRKGRTVFVPLRSLSLTPKRMRLLITYIMIQYIRRNGRQEYVNIATEYIMSMPMLVGNYVNAFLFLTDNEQIIK